MKPTSASKQAKKLASSAFVIQLKAKPSLNSPLTSEISPDIAKQYRDLVELANEGFTIVDPQDNFIFTNPQFAHSLGYEVNELIGKSLFDLAEQASVTKIKNEMRKRKKGEKSRYEVTLIHKNGSPKHFWLSASPRFDSNGMFLGSMGVYSDITQKKVMELHLEKRAREMNALYQSYAHARSAIPYPSMFKGVLEALVQAFPDHSTIQAKILFDDKNYTYPKKITPFAYKIQTPIVIAGFKRGYLQLGYGKKNLSASQFDLNQSQRLINNVAEILCKHVYTREIATRYEAIVNKAFNGIVIVHAGKIRYSNPQFGKIFKYRYLDIVNQPLKKFLPQYSSSSIPIHGKAHDALGMRSDKKQINLTIINLKTTFHGKSAQLIRLSDVTELKKAQMRLSHFNQELKSQVKEKTKHLKEANIRLQSLNQIKDDFIATTSHELRSPLTSIRGYLSFLVEDESLTHIPNPYKSYLIRAYNNADTLNYLVNNILDTSRLDMGRFNLQLNEVDLIKLVQGAIESMSFQASEKKINIQLNNKTKQAKFMVRLDSIRIAQVLRNILDNAIKHTKGIHSITVDISKENRMAKISISDRGIGVPKANLSQIFGKFVQIKNLGKDYKKGLGLGLFITKNIVKLHGGTITANTNKFRGLTVSFKLPIKANI